LHQFEAELAEQENWNEVQHGLKARVVVHPDGEASEKYLLCRIRAPGSDKFLTKLAARSDNRASSAR
jgi:hypothetical protein